MILCALLCSLDLSATPLDLSAIVEPSLSSRLISQAGVTGFATLKHHGGRRWGRIPKGCGSHRSGSFETRELIEVIRVADQPESRDFQIFHRHYDAVYYWFIRQGLPVETCRDLTQDVFCAAFKGLDQFKENAGPKTWLLRIARNTYLNHLRDRRAQKRAAQEVSLSGSDDESRPLDPAEPGEGPDKVLEVKERDESLHGALAHLPQQMRQCLELRLEDLKYREIADIMGLSIDTVKSHLHQARLKLRKRLGPEPEGEGGAS